MHHGLKCAQERCMRGSPSRAGFKGLRPITALLWFLHSCGLHQFLDVWVEAVYFVRACSAGNLVQPHLKNWVFQPD